MHFHQMQFKQEPSFISKANNTLLTLLRLKPQYLSIIKKYNYEIKKNCFSLYLS